MTNIACHSVYKIRLMVSLFLLLGSSVSLARENMGFLSEHLVEAAQDARAFVLPWADNDRQSVEWKPIIGASVGDVGIGFANLRGQLVTVGASRAWNKRWTSQMFVFYDYFGLEGNTGEELVSGSSLANVPLDLPAQAQLSPKSGYLRHVGVSFAGILRWQQGQSSWSMIGGLQLSRFELVDFQFDYRLMDGADTGSDGIIDYSSNNYFLTPYLGGQYRYPLGARLLILPRFTMGVPLIKGKFDTRLTGPGFDLSTDSPGGHAENLGDGFITLGMGLRDRRTGIEFDIGSVLSFALIEDATHPGVDTSVLISFTWFGL